MTVASHETPDNTLALSMLLLAETPQPRGSLSKVRKPSMSGKRVEGDSIDFLPGLKRCRTGWLQIISLYLSLLMHRSDI